MLRALILMLCLGAMPGCTALGLLGGSGEALAVYELPTPRLDVARPARMRGEIVIEEPVASGAIATDRIMIRPGPFEAQYLPGARWADPAPQMVQTLILRSLSETGAFRSVGRRPLAGNGDFAVLTELTDFHATLGDAAGPVVTLRAMVRLVRESDARVLAQRTFVATAPAPGTDVDALVPAFNAAMQELLGAMVPWLIDRT